MVQWLPENIASYGADFDHVISNIYNIVGVWFLAAEAILLFFILRYRRSASRKASYITGHTWAALAWVLIPAAFVFAFDLSMDHQQIPVWREIKETLPAPDQVVLVKGRQFVWEFTYAGSDKTLGTADDTQSMNQFYVPVNEVVQLQLESDDVLHSFWVPNLRFKQDVVPGRSIKGWFKAIKTGRYQIACAELCGVGHGNMGGWLHVLSPENYQKWLQGEEIPQ